MAELRAKIAADPDGRLRVFSRAADPLVTAADRVGGAGVNGRVCVFV